MNINQSTPAQRASSPRGVMDAAELRAVAIEQMALKLMTDGLLKISKHKSITISDAFFYVSDDDLFCTSIARWTTGDGNGNSAKELVRDAVSQFCEKHIDAHMAYLAQEDLA